MTTELKESEISALRRACACLFLAVQEDIARDVQGKAEAVITLLQDTRTRSPVADETLRAIIKRISDSALELANMRHSFCDMEGDEFSVDAFAEIKEDTIDCMTGDETGCNDPEDLNATNCELIWLRELLAAKSASTPATDHHSPDCGPDCNLSVHPAHPESRQQRDLDRSLARLAQITWDLICNETAKGGDRTSPDIIEEAFRLARAFFPQATLQRPADLAHDYQLGKEAAEYVRHAIDLVGIEAVRQAVQLLTSADMGAVTPEQDCFACDHFDTNEAGKCSVVYSGGIPCECDNAAHRLPADSPEQDQGEVKAAHLFRLVWDYARHKDGCTVETTECTCGFSEKISRLIPPAAASPTPTESEEDEL